MEATLVLERTPHKDRTQRKALELQPDKLTVSLSAEPEKDAATQPDDVLTAAAVDHAAHTADTAEPSRQQTDDRPEDKQQVQDSRRPNTAPPARKKQTSNNRSGKAGRQRRRPPQLKNSNSNQPPAAEPSGSAQQPPEPEPLPDSLSGEAHSTPSATVNTHRTHDKHSRPEASVPREQQGEKLHFSLKLPAAAVNNRFGEQLKQIPDKAKAGLAALPAGCSRAGHSLACSLRDARDNAAEIFTDAAHDAQQNLLPALKELAGRVKEGILWLLDNIIYGARWLWYYICRAGEETAALYRRLRQRWQHKDPNS